MYADGQNESIGKAHGACNHVEMTIGDRIEGPGEKGDARHGPGLTVAPFARKAALERVDPEEARGLSIISLYESMR
jgi:hypothetical protein